MSMKDVGALKVLEEILLKIAGFCALVQKRAFGCYCGRCWPSGDNKNKELNELLKVINMDNTDNKDL